MRRWRSAEGSGRRCGRRWDFDWGAAFRAAVGRGAKIIATVRTAADLRMAEESSNASDHDDGSNRSDGPRRNDDSVVPVTRSSVVRNQPEANDAATLVAAQAPAIPLIARNDPFPIPDFPVFRIDADRGVVSLWVPHINTPYSEEEPRRVSRLVHETKDDKQSRHHADEACEYRGRNECDAFQPSPVSPLEH